MPQALAMRLDNQRDRSPRNKPSIIPEVFCWTKMGTEAGQPLTAILRRKELERMAGEGTFAWGIGNSLGGAADQARQMSPSGDVDVLFTPMKSAPKAIDVMPSQLLLWMFYQDRRGSPTALPEHMLVTSRGGSSKRVHYALLCKADASLEEQLDSGSFDSSGVRNLVSMNPVGASQVTSVVRFAGDAPTATNAYRVAFRARLYAEGFVKLVAPVPLDEELTGLYEEVCSARTKEAWRSGVLALKTRALARKTEHGEQRELLLA